MNKNKRESYLLCYRLSVIAFGVSIIIYDALAVSRQPLNYRWAVVASFAMIASWVASSELPSARSIVTVSDAFVFLTILLFGPEYAVS